ncbi:MAG: hypothetical protein ACE5HV_13570 [Acidobacteriota bacterium]
MVYLTALWLPVVLSAVIVFIASAIIHMALPFHKNDYAKLPGEDNLLEAMRKEGVGRGDYVFPCAGSHKALQTPEMQEKCKRGPVGFMTVVPSGVPRMGKSLTIWFIYLLVMSFFVAYLTGRTLGAGSEYLAVFRVAGTVAFLGYAGAHASGSIWLGRRWSTTIKSIVDGLVYGLLTAGTFGWLWPR